MLLPLHVCVCVWLCVAKCCPLGIKLVRVSSSPLINRIRKQLMDQSLWMESAVHVSVVISKFKLTIVNRTRGIGMAQLWTETGSIDWNWEKHQGYRGTREREMTGAKKGQGWRQSRDVKGWGGGGLRKRTSERERHCSAAGADSVCRGPAVRLQPD